MFSVRVTALRQHFLRITQFLQSLPVHLQEHIVLTCEIVQLHAMVLGLGRDRAQPLHLQRHPRELHTSPTR